MSFIEVADGLYLGTRPAQGSGKNFPNVTHYGVIDIGNLFRNTSVKENFPVVYHKSPQSGLIVEYINRDETWTFKHPITDLEGARERLNEAAKNPAYRLFGDNCEHFANYVAWNRKVSVQSNALQLFIGVAILAFALTR